MVLFVADGDHHRKQLSEMRAAFTFWPNECCIVGEEVRRINWLLGLVHFLLISS